jgi:hypothetical protein
VKVRPHDTTYARRRITERAQHVALKEAYGSNLREAAKENENGE